MNLRKMLARGLPPRSRLYDLVKNGDTEAVRDLLVDAQQPDEDLIAALYEAIQQRNAEMVECLIDAGALLTAGASLDEYDALHWAVKSGDIQIVQLLLGARASVGSKTTALYTALWIWSEQEPLERAAQQQYSEIIELLVGAGASLDSASDIFILDSAASYGNLDTVRWLVEHVDDKKKFVNATVEKTRQNRVSALWSAVNSGHLDIIRTLVEAGADPLLPCTSRGVDQLAIHAAFKVDRGSDVLEIIRYLITLNKDQLEKKTSEGKTCLHLAAETNNAECADWLLSQKANFTAKTNRGETPWQRARKENNVAAMRVFLRKEIESYTDRHNGFSRRQQYVMSWSGFLQGRSGDSSLPFCWGGGVSSQLPLE
ncbi:ankyrin repeat-containing domain protein [Hypoxylon crocopeplum]|nr:ankyrin repeat-containing domain protein [Hypoxylon crocopeplum]